MSYCGWAQIELAQIADLIIDDAVRLCVIFFGFVFFLFIWGCRFVPQGGGSLSVACLLRAGGAARLRASYGSFLLSPRHFILSSKKYSRSVLGGKIEILRFSG